MSAAPSPELPNTQPPNTHLRNTQREIEVFFDGDCPLCAKEVRMIASKDKRGRIAFTDIAAQEFDATARGYTQKQLMDEIQAVLPDGTRLSGIEVFRRMYSLIGFEGTVSLTRLWGVRHGLDVAYKVWAKNRLRLTGRCTGDVCDVNSGAVVG